MSDQTDPSMEVERNALRSLLTDVLARAEAAEARVCELEDKVHLREGQYLASAEREQTLEEAVARVEALADNWVAMGDLSIHSSARDLGAFLHAALRGES